MSFKCHKSGFKCIGLPQDVFYKHINSSIQKVRNPFMWFLVNHGSKISFNLQSLPTS